MAKNGGKTMKKIKRSRKGFTLIELIIVMAIFSIIMTLVMSFIDPVSKLMKKTSIRERTNSYVDNIGEYVDNSLRYAKFVQIHEGGLFERSVPEVNLMGTSPGLVTEVGFRSAEQKAVMSFVNNYFDGAVNADYAPLTGKIRVLEFINEDVGGFLNPSMIYESIYDFTAGNIAIDPTATASLTCEQASRAVLNSEHLENYNYYFKLGYYTLDPINDQSNYTGLVDTNDYYYSRLVKLTNSLGPLGTMPDIYRKEYLPINVIAYSNQAGSRVESTYDDGVTVENVTAFKSPNFMNTVSLTLINAINAEDASNAHVAAYYKKKYHTVTDPATGATSLEPMVNPTTGKIICEPVSMASLAAFYHEKANFYDATLESENFYVIFILPYEIDDSKITLN